MSGGGAHVDPVGTIRRETHPVGVEVRKNGHEGLGYTIWVLTGGPGGARSWIRVESTNWDYGFSLSLGNAHNFSEIVGVVPGSEADRQYQQRLRELAEMRQLVAPDPSPEKIAEQLKELET